MPADVGRQIPLGISLRPGYEFASFFAGSNQLALDMLKACGQAQGEQQIFLYGPESTGKSHLLQAACRQAAVGNQQSAYLPLSQFSQQIEILQGLESLSLVCLDELDAVVGRSTSSSEWEEQIFHLLNRLRANHVFLLLAARVNPAALGIQLPDLESRLNWGPVIKLEALNDEQLRLALDARAKTLGLGLSGQVLDYLLTRGPRDTGKMFALLDLLDRESLAEQRRLTIPFIKSHLTVFA